MKGVILISFYCLKIRVIFLSAPFQVSEVLLDTYSIDCSMQRGDASGGDGFQGCKEKKKKRIKKSFPFQKVKFSTLFIIWWIKPLFQ